MKNFKKICITIVSILILSSGVSAQGNTAIGIRFGGQTSGLTIRQFTNSNTALEGIVSFGHNSFLVTGLYEKFVPISNAPNLKWFYGIGGHVGFFSQNGYYFHNGRTYTENTTVLGVDGILGLDLKLRNAPISIGIDIKPFLDFDSGTSIFGDGALNLRFIF